MSKNKNKVKKSTTQKVVVAKKVAKKQVVKKKPSTTQKVVVTPKMKPMSVKALKFEIQMMTGDIEDMKLRLESLTPASALLWEFYTRSIPFLEEELKELESQLPKS